MFWALAFETICKLIKIVKLKQRVSTKVKSANAFSVAFLEPFSLWRSMPTTSGAFGFSIVLMAKIDDEELEEIG